MFKRCCELCRERWRKWSVRALLVAWASMIGIPLLAEAGDVNLSWQNPTGQETCSDAGPLTNLAGTKIYQLVATINDPSATSYTIEGMTGGEYEYVATSFTDTGENSRLSGTTTKTVEPLKVVDNRAYVLAKLKDAYLTTVAGTIPLDTPCDESHKVNELYVVPVDLVQWTINPATEQPYVTDVLALAECG